MSFRKAQHNFLHFLTFPFRRCIHTFYSAFPGVKQFQQKVVAEGKSTGFGTYVHVCMDLHICTMYVYMHIVCNAEDIHIVDKCNGFVCANDHASKAECLYMWATPCFSVCMYVCMYVPSHKHPCLGLSPWHWPCIQRKMPHMLVLFAVKTYI